MPVKWTPEKDRTLLLKILETHDISVDVKRVAAAWPSDNAKEMPTPRAIKERLVKLRQLSRERETGNFSIFEDSPTSTSTTTTTPPRKPRQMTTGTPGVKRKRFAKNAKADELGSGAGTPTKIIRSESVAAGTSLDGLKNTITTGVDSSSSTTTSPPSKRPRTAAGRIPGMVSGYDDSEEDEGYSDDDEGTDYVPDDIDAKAKSDQDMDSA